VRRSEAMAGRATAGVGSGRFGCGRGPGRVLAVVLLSVFVLGGARASAQSVPDVAGGVDGAVADALEPGADEPGPEAPTVGASLDRIEALVGDQLTLTVSAVARGAVAQTIRLGEPVDLGKFERLESSHVDRDLGDGKFSRRFVLQIAAFEPGELEVPGIRLEFTDMGGRRHAVSTTPIPVHIKSLLKESGGTAGEEGAEVKPQPARPPRSVIVEDLRLVRWLEWLAGGMGGVVVLGLLGRWIARSLKRRREAEAVAEPVVPADVMALGRLAALRGHGDFARERYRPFFFEVAEIVRAYLGARFGFDALELTTTELLAELERVRLPAQDLESYGRVVSFLEASDLVKFASAPSSDVEALAALDAAETIVRRLSASAQESAPAPAAPAREAAGA
jgi:hypothetical protein